MEPCLAAFYMDVQRTSPHAVVVVSFQTKALHNRTGCVVVQRLRLEAGGHHSARRCALAAAEQNQPPTRCWWSGCAGGFGRGDAASWLLLVDPKRGHDAAFTPPATFCVPPPVPRVLSRNSSFAPVRHCLSGWGMAPKTLSSVYPVHELTLRVIDEQL